jgi:hypothetical protein
MHPALFVEEIVSSIFEEFMNGADTCTLLALTTTNRIFSEAALDILWEVVDIWDLAKQMDSRIWTIHRIDSTKERYGEVVEYSDLELVSRTQLVYFGDCSSCSFRTWWTQLPWDRSSSLSAIALSPTLVA